MGHARSAETAFVQLPLNGLASRLSGMAKSGRTPSSCSPQDRAAIVTDDAPRPTAEDYLLAKIVDLAT